MTITADTPRFQGMRKRLVEDLRQKGITDEHVLHAIAKIPRHLFIGKGFEEHAYEDKAFKIAAGQTISQPLTVAIQSSLLDAEKGMKVLEIGTGSGYQTSVLCELGLKVFSIERQRELYVQAKQILGDLKYQAKLFFGDGYQGLPAFAPFDRVIITCGAPYVPEKLIEQLKVGGKMIIPLGEKIQVMNVFTRVNEREIVRKEYGEFRFVPMIEKKAR